MNTLDHHGKWKATHHLVRRTFAPLAVIGVEDRPTRTLTVHIVNDHAGPVAGEFTLSATTCAGTELAGSPARLLRREKAPPRKRASLPSTRCSRRGLQ